MPDNIGKSSTSRESACRVSNLATSRRETHGTLSNRMNAGPAIMTPDASDEAVVHIVDDDASLCLALEELFGSIGLVTQFIARPANFWISDLTDLSGCIVIDIRLPDMNGLEFQAELTRMGIRLPVVMMTGYGDVPMSVRAMKGGAVDFLLKPFRDQDMLDAALAAIRRDRERRMVEGETSPITRAV